VNNAGFGDISPFEQLSAERFKAAIDANFYGVVNVTRSPVPHMRKQRSGCILQISCSGTIPFGVTVCALEPGGMRTNWGARANQHTPNSSPPMNRPSALLPRP
jgi:hypothetical protein